ncbi:TetR/AcrR family transcriptional regulator [Vagococcus carniphilus]|uniref:TetR family transcriptional regulator n=1 Tax=Vagococcus carniphilus TaxID=218144 RepID=A0A430B6N8_9ENTE|nr:TetR/AcrR family transcriptional regulator [Vagococcus carniphilus]QNN72883.1 TetR/AcrR family transcriptional regulator C-terminal domain-containing protein [Vagococcus carniphilus]RSU15990.1 TetR family transcriptional regulator [Vagococcus carniphilus]
MKENDLRYLRTRKMIIEAMVNLLKTSNFNDISVTSICKEAQISRSGFYLHYLDKYDLVESFLKDYMVKANQLIQTNDILNKKDFMLTMLTHLKNEGQLIALLLSKNGSIDVQTSIKEMVKENARKNILPFLNVDISSTVEEQYILAYLSNALFGVLQEWINNGQKESPETIVNIINKLMTNKLN